MGRPGAAAQLGAGDGAGGAVAAGCDDLELADVEEASFALRRKLFGDDAKPMTGQRRKRHRSAHLTTADL